MLRKIQPRDPGGARGYLWIDCQPDFRTAHYLDGFAYPDGKFRFKPEWTRLRAANNGAMEPILKPSRRSPTTGRRSKRRTPRIRSASPPRRPAPSSTRRSMYPASSRAKEGGRPEVLIHPADAGERGIGDGTVVRLGIVVAQSPCTPVISTGCAVASWSPKASGRMPHSLTATASIKSDGRRSGCALRRSGLPRQSRVDRAAGRGRLDLIEARRDYPMLKLSRRAMADCRWRP